jgi:uridine kinase
MNQSELLKTIVSEILNLPSAQTQLVAIDGVDGAGKTVLADNIAPLIRNGGRPVIRSSVDGFHNPRDVRYRLGKGSPEGFFKDSYNYSALKEVLLNPLKTGEYGVYTAAIFDVDKNEPLSSEREIVEPKSILIFDGIFLHRDELKDFWNYSIFLDVAFEYSIPRGAQRGSGSPDILAESNVRYIEGQKLYLHQCCPQKRASIVIDYNNLNKPHILNRN